VPQKFFHDGSSDPPEQDPELLAPNSGASASVLLYDDRLGNETPTPAEHSLRCLRLPAGPASPVAHEPDSLSLVEVEPSEADNDAAIFVTVLGSVGERLLMFTRPGSRVRVNGLPAPVVVPLSLGDQVGIDPERLLHVSRLSQTAPVLAPAWLIGKSCEVCLLPFVTESPVVLCSSCGAARHMEGEEVSPEDRLQCAAFGACPNCRSESPEASGLTYVPED